MKIVRKKSQQATRDVLFFNMFTLFILFVRVPCSRGPFFCSSCWCPLIRPPLFFLPSSKKVLFLFLFVTQSSDVCDTVFNIFLYSCNLITAFQDGHKETRSHTNTHIFTFFLIKYKQTKTTSTHTFTIGVRERQHPSKYESSKREQHTSKNVLK